MVIPAHTVLRVVQLVLEKDKNSLGISNNLAISFVLDPQ